MEDRHETGRRSSAPGPAAAIFEVLKGWGVEYVFTCPGSTEAAFLDASLRYPDVQVILTTHESVAVAMADGASRVTGRPAVAYLHANVGLANGVASLYAAHVAGSPVVVLNGMKPTAIQNRSGFTTSLHMRDVVRDHVKWDWQVLRTDAIAEDINRAFKIASSQPMGPTWVGISQDLLESSIEVPVPDAARYSIPAATRPDPHSVDRAVDLLRRASRPLVVAGGEVARVNAEGDLERLCERIAAPVMSESQWTLERSCFSTAHSHYAGVYSGNRQSVQDADVIFLAGSRSMVEFMPPSEPEIPESARIIHCHPDPREIGKVYGVDAAVVGDAKLSLSEFLSALGGDVSEEVLAGRRGYLARARSEYLDSTVPVDVADSGGRPIEVPQLMQMLAESLEGDGDITVIGDAVTSSSTLFDALPVSATLDYHRSSAGALGWGMGAPLGMKLADPSRYMLAVVGDGVFQFCMQALWTAARYQIPVTFVVVNNQAYAAVRASLYRFGGEARKTGSMPGTEIAGANLAAVSEGLGVAATRVEELGELDAALVSARESGAPRVIEVMTDPDDVGLRQYDTRWQKTGALR